MLSTHYNWTRYWHPKGESIHLDGVGFPFVPGILNKNLVTFDSIAHHQCLALFGEPGIGKSTVLESEYKAAKEMMVATGNASMFRDLGTYSTDAALVRDIFEDETFVGWERGSHVLELFLDSLDECRLRVESIDSLLLSRLQRYDLSRLRLRIGCRSADWSVLLEKRLPKLWGDDAVAQYQLAPLGREHVRAAAAAEDGIDPDEFLRQVQQKQVTGLAIKPITLRMLLAIYHSHGSFPAHRANIFLDGCTLLAAESNESRLASQRVGEVKAQERVAIAARIAAASVFSNSVIISKRSGTKEPGSGVVTLNEISGGREFVGGEFVEVTDTALIETLGTALFEPTQDGDLRWSHQTYAEFLAAWYLKQRGLSVERVMTLLVHPSDPEHRIVPQLHEVAANVAHVVPGALEQLLHYDPEVLIRSDMTAVSAETREAAVDSLLKLYAEERTHEPEYLSINYGSFKHPNLTGQLRPYLVEANWNVEVRKLAISFVEDCVVKELQQELLVIAFDDSQPMMVRVKAADALKEIGDSDIKLRLMPLVYKDDTDEHEDLRGVAFMAVWPELMSAEELFKAITHPSESFYGLYSVFLSNHVVTHLKPEDLSTALRWVSEQANKSNSLKFQSLADEIILRAWEHLEEPGVLDVLADIFLSRLRRFEDVLSRSRHEGEKEEFKNDPHRRRRLFTAMLPKLTNPDSDWRLFLRSHFVSFSQSDVDWLLDMLDVSESTAEQQVLAKIIRHYARSPEPALLSKLIGVCMRHLVLAYEFRDLIMGVQLDSAAAEAARSEIAEDQEYQAETETSETPYQTPAERVARCLNLIEEGKLGGWVGLNLELTLEGTNTVYENVEVLDLTALPGWMNADAPTRRRIVAAAKKFVLEHTPNEYEWLVDFPDDRWVQAGQRAWLFLLRECRDFIAQIPLQIWERWGHFLVVNPPSDKSEVIRAEYDSLIELAHRKVRVDIAEGLYAKLNHDDREKGHTSLFHNFGDYWNDAFARRLIHRIADKELSPGVFRASLRWLLQHGVSPAKQSAESLLTQPLPSAWRDRQRALIAAHLLLMYVEDAGWRFVWRAVETDPQFGRALLVKVAHSRIDNRKVVAPRLREHQLADLYIWLAREFPHAEDPHHVGSFSPSWRDDIMWWRDGLLKQLQERGTVEASVAVNKIVEALPHLPFLKYVLREARAKTRWSTWEPLEPDDVVTLLTDEEKRVVQNGDQLLGVLVESLRRLESRLQGETPAASDLWNEIRGKGKNFKYTPKDEDRFSDYVKRHLESDLVGSGVVINREVEIRRGTGKGDGERTDIHVAAVVSSTSGDDSDVVRAIVETKGCWNRSLRTAMENQLVGRYLKDNKCRHGLYLVGWFLCESWDGSDQRKKETRKVSIDEIRKELDVQAETLSVGDLNVRAVVLNTALR
jgi:hypothetical protein